MVAPLFLSSFFNLLNSLPFVSLYLVNPLTPENLHLFVFGFIIRNISLSIPYLNEKLEFSNIQFRRARFESLTISLAFAPQPIRINFRGLDAVLVLSSLPPESASAACAWKHDFLFLDTIVRLARLNFFKRSLKQTGAADSRRSGCEGEEASGKDFLLPSSPMRWAARFFLNLLIRVEVESFACRFEDAPPPLLYRGTVGFGWAITLFVGSICNKKLLECGERLAEGGHHRGFRVEGLRAFYDAGVVRSCGELMYSPLRTEAVADAVDVEVVSVAEYVPPGAQPFFEVASFTIAARLDNACGRVSARFKFDTAVHIALDTLQFQSCLHSIFRVPLRSLSLIAMGAVEDQRRQDSANLDTNSVVEGFSVAVRDRYLVMFKNAMACQMEGRAASLLFEFEKRFTLDECISFREWAGTHDLLDVWADARRRFGQIGLHAEEMIPFSQLHRDFESRLAESEEGAGGFEACNRRWNVSDSTAQVPRMTLFFYFGEATLHMQPSPVLYPVETDDQRCGGIDMTVFESHIDVFSSSRIDALVVELEIGRVLAVAQEKELWKSFSSPFLMMRFRQDGMLSPTMPSMQLVSSNCDLHATPSQLRFILEYFVPVESPLPNIMRRRCLKTVAAARRERALRSGAILSLRPAEQAPMLSVLLQNVTIYTKQDAKVCGSSLGGVGHEFPTHIVASGFEKLSIVSVSPPPHVFGDGNVLTVTESPVGLDTSDNDCELDPAGLLAQAHILRSRGASDYQGSDQLSSIRLEIAGIDINMILPDSAFDARDLTIVRGACLCLSSVYIGMPYSTREAYRVDNFLNVQWGSTRDVRILSRCLLPFVMCIKAVLDPILVLVERLGSIPTRWSESLAAMALQLTFPGADQRFLSSIDCAASVARGVRRLTGDVHVKFETGSITVVHPLGDEVVPSKSRASSAMRVYVVTSFKECTIRTRYYSSVSRRDNFRVQELTSEVSRGATRGRVFLAPALVTASLVRGVNIAQTLNVSTSALVVMCQTASLALVRDIQKLGLGISQGTSSFVLGETSNEAAIVPVSRRSNGILRCGEPFVLRLNSHLAASEIGVLSGDVDTCAIVQQGEGVELELLSCSGRREWFRICERGDANRSLIDLGNGQGWGQVLLSGGDSDCAWRLCGADPRHTAVQCLSGSYLSIKDGRIGTSSSVHYFCASRVDCTTSRKLLFEPCTLGKVLIESVRVKFGGGQSSSTSLSARCEDSQPGVLEVFLDSPVAEASCQSIDSQRRWEIKGSGTLGLIYCDLARRSKVNVISPSQVALRCILESSGKLVELQVKRLKANLSRLILHNVAISLKRFKNEDAVDDFSFFFLTNSSGRLLRFRILSEPGDASNRDSLSEVGSFYDVPSTQSRPFALPASTLEPPKAFSKKTSAIVDPFPSQSSQSDKRPNDHVSDFDHVMELELESYRRITCTFGLLKRSELNLVSNEGRPALFFLRVMEDESRGAMCVEVLSAIGVKNFLPIPIDLLAGSRGRFLGRAPVFQTGCGELGLQVSRKSPVAFRASRGSCSRDVQLLQIVSGEVLAFDISAPNSGDGGPPLRSGYESFSSSDAFELRALLSCQRKDEKRQVIEIAPLFVLRNCLMLPIEFLIDDGASCRSLSLKSMASARWLREAFTSGASEGQVQDASLIMFVPALASGHSVQICERSSRNIYRLRLRDVGGKWTRALVLDLSQVAGPGRRESGRAVLKESISIGTGVVEVVVKYDHRGSLCVCVASQWVLKNLSGYPLKISSATKAASLGRLAPRQNVFVVRQYLYFQESEVGIGLDEEDEWSKKTLHFDADEAEVVRIPCQSSKSGGLQLHVECSAENIVTIRPLVTFINRLPYPVDIYSGGDRQGGVFAIIYPLSSGSYHDEYHLRDSMLPSKLDSVISSGAGKLRFAVGSNSILSTSRSIQVERSCVFPLAVLRLGGLAMNPKEITTNTAYTLLGIRCKVDNGRFLIQLLPNPPYGPAVSLSSMCSYAVVLADGNLAEPICKAFPGGDMAAFAWRFEPDKNRVLYLSIQDKHGRQSSHSAITLAILESAPSNITCNVALTLNGKEVALRVVLQKMNGFMCLLQVFEAKTVPKKQSDAPVLAIHNPDDPFSISAHCVVPRLLINVADLVSVSLTGMTSSFMKSNGDEGRMTFTFGLQGFDVRNKSSKNPVHKFIMTRATRGAGVDERTAVVSVSAITRLPHTKLNPSDLLHFERCNILFQPVVLNLESRLIDRVCFFIGSLLRSFRGSPNFEHPYTSMGTSLGKSAFGGSQLAPSDFFEFGDEILWGRIPLYFDESVVWSPLVCTFSFENNGGLRLGKVSADRYKLSSLVRLLVVGIIPQIKEANLRFDPPVVASRVFLSGELSRTVIRSLAKQWLHILRQLLPNVAILSTIEAVVRGRRKGEENTRRLDRALALGRRATSALHDSPRLRFSSISSPGSTSSSSVKGLARWNSEDKLARLLETSDNDSDDDSN